MPAKGQIVTPAIDRFMDKVSPEPMSGCWLWVGAIDHSFGYGKFRLDGLSINAHRASWILSYGPIPDALFVCHRCDNSACVNPTHLFLGDSDANNKDRAAKGRTVSKRGEENNKAKLTSEIVLHIRSLWDFGLNVTDVARFLSADIRTVWDICKRKTWRHI